jgi:hypothetical protein
VVGVAAAAAEVAAAAAEVAAAAAEVAAEVAVAEVAAEVAEAEAEVAAEVAEAEAEVAVAVEAEAEVAVLIVVSGRSGVCSRLPRCSCGAALEVGGSAVSVRVVDADSDDAGAGVLVSDHPPLLDLDSDVRVRPLVVVKD